jgi:hypothetical protein
VTTWQATGAFARGRYCPEHGYPLRAWARSGKVECPVRWCPYVEPQGDVETVKLEFPVPEWECTRRDKEAADACACPDHEAMRRVLATMQRRRWDLFPKEDA